MLKGSSDFGVGLRYDVILSHKLVENRILTLSKNLCTDAQLLRIKSD